MKVIDHLSLVTAAAMSELREARGPRPQRLKWTSVVLRSLSLVSTCLGNENKVRPQRHTLVIFCSASLIEKNGILACYQDKKNYTKNQNKQTKNKPEKGKYSRMQKFSV